MKKRKRKPAPAASAPADRDVEIRALQLKFGTAVPSEAAQTGVYQPKPGDAFHGLEVRAPDATYRVLGSDWLLTVKGQRLVEAARARPGNVDKDVVSVPSHG